MDIDEIEDNLNNHEFEQGKVLNEILQGVAKTQAVLQIVLDMQVSIIMLIAPNFPEADLQKEILLKTQVALAEIQADISSRLQGD